MLQNTTCATIKVSRQMLQCHKKDEMDYHMTLLMNELRVVKEKHKEQVKRLEDELKETKQEVSTRLQFIMHHLAFKCYNQLSD